MLCIGMLETPVSSDDIPVIRSTKFLYQSCINLSMMDSVLLRVAIEKFAYRCI